MSLRVHALSNPPAEAERLLEEDPRATIFLHPKWMNALVRGYPRLSPRYLVVEEDGEVAGFTPLAEIRPGGFREVVSMPFGTHGGPVLARGISEEGIRLLHREFVALTRRFGTARFEMTLFDPSETLTRELESALGSHRVTAATRLLDLTPGPEDLWKGYTQQLRRSVRVARKAGVEVREEPGTAGLDAFSRLYAGQSREWDIPWHHSRAALGEIVDSLGDDARIWVASHEGKDVCAQLTLYHEGREVHLWLSGAGPESRPVAAFHLLLAAIAEDAARKGYSWQSFGSSLGNPGVEKFKESFRPRSRPVVRFHHQAGWVRWLQRIRWR